MVRADEQPPDAQGRPSHTVTELVYFIYGCKRHARTQPHRSRMEPSTLNSNIFVTKVTALRILTHYRSHVTYRCGEKPSMYNPLTSINRQVNTHTPRYRYYLQDTPWAHKPRQPTGPLLHSSTHRSLLPCSSTEYTSYPHSRFNVRHPTLSYHANMSRTLLPSLTAPILR